MLRSSRRSSPFYPNMNLSQSLSIFTHCDGHVLGTVCQRSRDIQYVSVHDLDFCSYNFHISWFSRSVTCKGEVDVYRFMSKHSSDQNVFFCRDPLSHLAIDASLWIKLLMNHCVKYVTIAALLSFRYHSFMCKYFNQIINIINGNFLNLPKDGLSTQHMNIL